MDDGPIQLSLVFPCSSPEIEVRTIFIDREFNVDGSPGYDLQALAFDRSTKTPILLSATVLFEEDALSLCAVGLAKIPRNRSVKQGPRHGWGCHTIVTAAVIFRGVMLPCELSPATASLSRPTLHNPATRHPSTELMAGKIDKYSQQRR